MSNSTAAPSQPRKRLFILLLGGTSGLILGLAFLLRWVPSVGLLKGHPALPLIGKFNERPPGLRINPRIQLTDVKKNWQAFVVPRTQAAGTVALNN